MVVMIIIIIIIIYLELKYMQKDKPLCQLRSPVLVLSAVLFKDAVRYRITERRRQMNEYEALLAGPSGRAV